MKSICTDETIKILVNYLFKKGQYSFSLMVKSLKPEDVVMCVNYLEYTANQRNVEINTEPFST